MTANPPDAIELPERVYGPCRSADVPDGWEWEYAAFVPERIDAWHTYRPQEDFLVWVREPEPATIEIDADLAVRLAHDASLAATHGSKLRTTAAERALLRAAAKKAKRADR